MRVRSCLLPRPSQRCSLILTSLGCIGFLSSSWHIRSHGMFAGSCIGTILLVLCLEFLRRMGREYDAFILRRARLRQMYSMTPAKQAQKKGTASNPNNRDCPCDCPQNDDPITTDPGMQSSNAKLVGSNDVTSVAAEGVKSVDGDVPGHRNSDTLPPYRPSLVEQVIRALFHMVQFAVAYFIMLLAMYYNGYIIICIFIGAFLGALIFSWEPLSLSKE